MGSLVIIRFPPREGFINENTTCYFSGLFFREEKPFAKTNAEGKTSILSACLFSCFPGHSHLSSAHPWGGRRRALCFAFSSPLLPRSGKFLPLSALLNLFLTRECSSEGAASSAVSCSLRAPPRGTGPSFWALVIRSPTKGFCCWLSHHAPASTQR